MKGLLKRFAAGEHQWSVGEYRLLELRAGNDGNTGWTTRRGDLKAIAGVRGKADPLRFRNVGCAYLQIALQSDQDAAPSLRDVNRAVRASIKSNFFYADRRRQRVTSIAKCCAVNCYAALPSLARRYGNFAGRNGKVPQKG